MSGRPQARMLPDGRRVHLQHGPIDLVVEAFGTDSECALARAQAVARFATVLDELVTELADLRGALGRVRPRLHGVVAGRMLRATWPLRASFITPMAAVAGAVADEVLAAAVDGRRLQRMYVNNGGDIAFMLQPGRSLRAAVMDGRSDVQTGTCELAADSPVRGLATSGWRGRSASLGIADAVTVAAHDAATADAAATLIANAVDADHPSILRRPARSMVEDSDLGELPVTVAVGRLDTATITTALARGGAFAEQLRQRGHIRAAVLRLAGRTRVIGADLALWGGEARKPTSAALAGLTEPASA